MNELRTIKWDVNVWETIHRDRKHRLIEGDVVLLLNDPPPDGLTQPVMARVLTRHGLGWMSWTSIIYDCELEPWWPDADAEPDPPGFVDE